jgi:phospholipid/cholesterol/gamma-HCH transport system substrate-binding protein
METRANYVLIGAFTLAVIAGAFGFVWWFQRLAEGGTRVAYEIAFDGSVSGLRPGASVLFNGIRVGDVVSLDIDPKEPRRVVATISVSSATPIRSDTKAGLEMQGLTGVASVTLAGGTSDAPPLKGEGGRPPRIGADPSQFTDLMVGAKQLVARLDGIALRVDKLLESNEKKVDQILTDIAAFASDLRGKEGRNLVAEFSDTAKKVQDAAQSIRELADHLGTATTPAIKEYQLLATEARRMVNDISRVVRDFERNPSQLIWGKSSTPAPAPARTAPAIPRAATPAAARPRQP